MCAWRGGGGGGGGERWCSGGEGANNNQLREGMHNECLVVQCRAFSPKECAFPLLLVLSVAQSAKAKRNGW